MPSAEVTSYTAHTGRLGLLGSERLIAIRHHHRGAAVDELSEGVSEIYFADRFADSTVGFSTFGNDEQVQAHLPLGDYETWIDLLRHEDPVYLHWSESEIGDPDSEGIIHLSTGPEPPGEGPTDRSPQLGK